MSLISCSATAATIIASDSVAADNIAARDDCSLADRMVSYFCLNINLHFCKAGGLYIAGAHLTLSNDFAAERSSRAYEKWKVRHILSGILSGAYITHIK